MTLLISFKSKLSLHRHRGDKGYEYACPLTLGTESCQSITHQDHLCNFVISEVELIEKVLSIAMQWTREGRGGM